MCTLRRYSQKTALFTYVGWTPYICFVFFFWIILYLIMASNKSRTLLIFLCSTPRVSNSFWLKGQKFIKRARFNTPKRPVLARKPYVWRPCPKLWFYHCVSVRDWCMYLRNILVLTSSKYRVTSRRKSRTPCVALHSKSCFFYSNKIWVSKLVPYILFKLVTFCYATKKKTTKC